MDIAAAAAAAVAETPAAAGGSGGGGGGGSSTKKATEQINCTQSWECRDWGECREGWETRLCYDVNSCESKYEAGEINNIITRTKPAPRRECVLPTVPAPVVPPTREPGVIADLIPEEIPVKLVAFGSLALLLGFGGIAVYWQFGTTSNRLRRKLKKIHPLIPEESSHILKDDYLGIYNLYLKLSEGKKQNFYGRVSKLREKLEDQLKNEKKMEELFQNVKGDLKQQKKVYLEINQQYQKLPFKVQKKYYPRIIRLREKLEKGN
jgi:hypothetical protein